MAEGTDQRRTRPYVAAVLAVGLLIGVLVIVLSASGRESKATEADAACLEEWNADPTMVAFGQHQFSGHGYERVEILRVSEQGQPTDAETGRCAVVFAANALDPEPGARAQVQLDGTWTGFENLTGITDEQIAALQADATSGVNSSLTTTGTLVATSPS